MTNSPDFISKIFAKHYLTALRIVSNTINRSNKHNNNSNVLLVTRALTVKSQIFYAGYGCNTKKMSFFKEHINNMDLSNIVIGTHYHMMQNLILYLIATWPSPNVFFTRQKIISVKIIFISKFLMKIKGVRFSFFTFFRLFMMAFSFLHILNFNNFAVGKSSKNSMFNWLWVIATLPISYVMYVHLCVGMIVKSFHHGHLLDLLEKFLCGMEQQNV